MVIMAGKGRLVLIPLPACSPVGKKGHCSWKAATKYAFCFNLPCYHWSADQIMGFEQNANHWLAVVGGKKLGRKITSGTFLTLVFPIISQLKGGENSCGMLSFPILAYAGGD